MLAGRVKLDILRSTTTKHGCGVAQWLAPTAAPQEAGV